MRKLGTFIEALFVCSAMAALVLLSPILCPVLLWRIRKRPEPHGWGDPHARLPVDEEWRT